MTNAPESTPTALDALWPAVLLPASAARFRTHLAPLTTDEWAWLVTQAQRHMLAPLLFQSIQPLSTEFPAAAPVIEKLRATYKQAVILSMRREGELRRSLTTLGAAGIRPTLFKGAALAHTIYPAPACRPMGDFDMWVTHAEMPAAIAALGGLGYRLHEKDDRPFALTHTTDGEVQMRPAPPIELTIELHWGVFAGEWLAYAAAVDRAGVRSRLVPAQIAGCPVYTLAPEDALIQLAVHMGINHQMSLMPLRSLVDVALLTRAHPLDWNAVMARARSWRVANVTGAVLAFAGTLFDLPDLAQPAAALAPAGMRKWLLERFITPEAILARPDLSTSKRRFAYLLCITDRSRDSMRLLTHTLWPDGAWLAARYGRYDLSTRLRHLTGAFSGDI